MLKTFGNFSTTSIILITAMIFLPSKSFSWQAEYELEVKWIEHLNKCAPCDLEGGSMNIISSKSINLNKNGKYVFDFEIDELELVDIELPSYAQKDLLPSNAEYSVEFRRARNENFAVIKYFPIINVSGSVKLLHRIKLKVIETVNLSASNRTATFAPSSILSSGSWYKIGVRQSGVHKLDASFLQSIGITTSGLNPNHINIYGNHIPELPTMNNLYHPDDLLKNSIFISGDGDGSFDASDYVLFYATGPDAITYGATEISASRNRIDSMAYYFIHIDASDLPKRISSISNSSDAVTHTANFSNAYYLHENDDINLLKSGDGWLGEHFDIELSHAFTANLGVVVPNSPVTMKTAIGSAVKSGTGSMTINVNGVDRDVITCPTLSGSYTEAKYTTSTTTFNNSANSLSFNLTFSKSSSASEAWLDYVLLNYQRSLNMSAGQFSIHHLPSVGFGNVVQYTIANASSETAVWEITDPSNIVKLNGTLAGSNYSFIQNADTLRKYVAFNNSQTLTPEFIKVVSNQNLHALPQADYIIVSHESLLAQADRLADLHRNNGLSVHVVEIQKVYNEFSGGASDPVAVRWFMKMFYDRAAGNPDLMPKYLCLFGDGTYDPLNRLSSNNYLIPTYNSVESNDIDYISSFTSDDFFGMLDDDEGISAYDLLDIGVGRIPVSDLSQAEIVVNKIEHYMNFGSYLYSNASGVQCNSDGYSSTFGDWRSRIVLMADDEDGGQFVNDCEALSDTVEKYHQEINIVKIYLDAYPQVVTSGGQRYPDAEEAINQNMNRGALIFNYVGHGGETGLSLERVVTIPMIEAWTNVNNLTVFISATCEFSRFDDPGRVSAGEITLMAPFGGAVGMLTTTRLVQVVVNTELVQNLYTVIFNEDDGEPLALGEILRQTKNLTAGSNNIRNFALLGDPALQLGKPQPKIVTDSINGIAINSSIDTLKSLSKITVTGHIEDDNGNLMSDYNGILFPTVYDKSKVRSTLGNDVSSPIKQFGLRANVIYKGKATVENGFFTFSFVVPKDIDYSFGKGKISYYSHNTNSNSYGFDTVIVVGGIDPNGLLDETGPVIDLFMNDENFANGGITDSRPIFIANVQDENGINTTGNGIGHDITLILDGNTAAPIVLNNFYEADLDTYQSGKVTYQFSELEEGPHSVTFKIWDVNNNSSEQTLDFVVVDQEELGIDHVLNYPNPFTTQTQFFFEHNQCCSSLEVTIEIFTVSGKLVRTLFDNVNTIAYRSEGISWDGRDEFGDKLARGVYVYRLTVRTPEGVKAEKVEKLVIL